MEIPPKGEPAVVPWCWRSRTLTPLATHWDVVEPTETFVPPPRESVSLCLQERLCFKTPTFVWPILARAGSERCRMLDRLATISSGSVTTWRHAYGPLRLALKSRRLMQSRSLWCSGSSSSQRSFLRPMSVCWWSVGCCPQRLGDSTAGTP